MRNFILIVLLLAGIGSKAHEGHDHDAPATVQAPKGGLIKSTEKTHIEVVAKGQEIKVYLYEMDLKPKNLEGVKVTLKAEMPRSKKTEVLKTVVSGNMFTSSFDAKGSHRYKLIIDIEEKGHGHTDTLNFNVEPRK